MFSNDQEDIKCPMCGYLYFKYARNAQRFCTCGSALLRIRLFPFQQSVESKKTPIPQAFYDAFTDESDIE